MSQPLSTRRSASVLPYPCRVVRLYPRAPVLRQIVPQWAGPGDTLFLEGEHLAGPDLLVEFGVVATWAVPLDDRTAFCIVPMDASGPVSVSRLGRRSNSVAFGNGWGDEPTRVLRVDPAHGLTGVFRDTPVLLRLSRPAHDATVTSETCRVEDANGMVPGHARLSPDCRVVIWRSDRLLEPGVEHRVTLAGALDERGRPITTHESAFVPCTLIRAEITG